MSGSAVGILSEMRFFVVLLALTSMTVTAGAFDIKGPGIAACSSWQEHHRNQQVAALMDEAWVTGFLSGIGASGWGNPLADISGADVIAWVANYCILNPKETFADAAMAFAKAHPH